MIQTPGVRDMSGSERRARRRAGQGRAEGSVILSSVGATQQHARQVTAASPDAASGGTRLVPGRYKDDTKVLSGWNEGGAQRGRRDVPSNRMHNAMHIIMTLR